MNGAEDNKLWVKAYEWVKNGIFNGSLNEGMPLSEGMMARKINISRTPIREALRILERDGYVSLVPGKGAFISSVSMEVVREIYEIRRLLEPYAARTAVRRIPENLLREAEEQWLKIQATLEKGGKIDWPKIASLDKDLHIMITAHTANGQIRNILLPYNARVERFQLLSAIALSNLRETVQQHLDIIACIKARDENELAELLLEHIISSEKNIRRLYSPLES
ncbi:MAG: GntR family transcriptional regulator [Synergistaceae bacterium]|jgi:DNA-binding GntR family transcriptional regulator|nr:GntR family transcriptional regulator [Synergistaceae bacterium]